MTDAAPMEFALKALFTADHAEAVNGKLYINGGGWNRLGFPFFPQVLPNMAVVAIVEVPFAKYQAEHQFEIKMVDPDGAALALKIDGNFRVGADPNMNYGDPTLMPFALPVHNLLIQGPGDYSFVFSIDGKELGRYPIRVMQVAIPMQFNLAPPPAPPASACGLAGTRRS